MPRQWSAMTHQIYKRKKKLCSHNRIEIRIHRPPQNKESDQQLLWKSLSFLGKAFQEETASSTATTTKEVDNSRWIK